MNERGNLVLHRLDHRPRAVAQQIAAPAGEEIEIAIAGVVPDRRAFAADEDNRKARVIANDETLILVEDGLAHD